MNLALVRNSVCFVCYIILFVACNQSRHIVSDSYKVKDKVYYEARMNKLNHLIMYGQKLLGASYKMGASGPKSFDCSGFTRYIFDSIKMSLPRTADDQARMGHDIHLKHVSVGDLLFFGKGKINHVAVVSKVQGKTITMLHASSSQGVYQQILQDSDYWMKRLRFARRVVI